MFDISQLSQDLQARARRVVDICQRDGVGINIYCGYRTLAEQAAIWRQSRPIADIQTKAVKLRDRGFPELAAILLGVGPQPGELGRHVTMAGPGESWHNFHEAFDAVPMVGGKPQWQTDAPAWQTYGKAVMAAGLVWAGTWSEFREYPHAQLRAGSSPLKTLTPGQVREALEL